MTRRQFLKVMFKAGAGLALAGVFSSILQSTVEVLGREFVIPYKPFSRADLYIRHELAG